MARTLIVGALLGQMKLVRPLADKAAELFALSGAEEAMLKEVPHRGTPMPPTDPLIYRFYELIMVNGPVEGADRRGIWRRHHVGDQFQPRFRAAAHPEKQSGENHDVPQVPALQILWRRARNPGIRLQRGALTGATLQRRAVDAISYRVASATSRLPEKAVRAALAKRARP
jgi:hypothetical protein